MTKNSDIYIQDYAFCNVLGSSKDEIWENLSQNRFLLQKDTALLANGSTYLGHIRAELPTLPAHLKEYHCRNNQVLAFCLNQLKSQIDELIARYSGTRIGVVMGTSTAGIDLGEQAIQHFQQTGTMDPDFHYRCQELGSASGFVAKYLAINGPHLSISTACSSSGRVFLSAQRMLRSGLVDAVLVGGADTLCHLTVNGFHSLASLSAQPNTPFAQQRKGINIGEAGAVFILTREKSDLILAGVGESSDAYHISAPEPQGLGAERAMRSALEAAQLVPEDIGYLNLHGTATPLNDQMESLAVARVFGQVPCSSTKTLTGHTLGAAGATEAAISCLLLEKYGQNSTNFLPMQTSKASTLDDTLPKIGLITQHNQELLSPVIMSNSFAFGGNNVSVIFKRTNNV
ncbi:TPA: beta-ketoacyl-[acyl-carrier-protein] synthase family protein [Pasteurella multocida]|nr:beta-ketoacyl-[acyl-carrier-protein] synthase family protein [Pasteurella multocida]